MLKYTGRHARGCSRCCVRGAAGEGIATYELDTHSVSHTISNTIHMGSEGH